MAHALLIYTAIYHFYKSQNIDHESDLQAAAWVRERTMKLEAATPKLYERLDKLVSKGSQFSAMLSFLFASFQSIRDGE